MSIKHSTAYHYADDTNLLLISKSPKKLNQQANHDLSALVKWLRANKISLNTNKTELIIFRTIYSHFKTDLNFRISGQKIIPVNSIKYLGIKLDQNLTFLPHHKDLALKLGRSNGMLAKIRHFVNLDTLINIYHAIFASHIRYACHIWGQARNSSFNKPISLQNKALRIIHFQNYNFNANVLYQLSRILKIQDQIQLLNCMLVWDNLYGDLPPKLKTYFVLSNDLHHHNLRSKKCNNLFMNHSRTVKYGINSINHQCARSWNNLPVHLKTETKFRESKKALSYEIKQIILDSYT